MLVLTRKVNEAILIGDYIELRIINVRGSGENAQVRIGIQAPEGLRILRKEIYDAVMAENVRAAAQGKVVPPFTGDGVKVIDAPPAQIDTLSPSAPETPLTSGAQSDQVRMSGTVPLDDAGLLYDTVEYLQAMGRYHEAVAALLQGINTWPNYTDFYFLLGSLYLQLGKIREAEQAFLTCLEKGEMPEGVKTVKGVGSFLAHYNLGVIYEMQRAQDKASLHYCEAARAGYPFAELRAGLLGRSCQI